LAPDRTVGIGAFVMGKIFICYRRHDSLDMAGRLYDKLEGHFGNDAVFMDVDSLSVGERFPEKIRSTIAQCDVFLALIGRQWLDSRDGDGRRRLDDTEDYVRLEIEEALRQRVTPVPVLLHGAEMPSKKALPATFGALTEFHAARLRPNPDFKHDVGKLIDGIEAAIAGREKERVARQQAERERAEQETAERERMAHEQAERKRAEREQIEREQAERQRAAQEAAERERIAQEQAAREQADRETVERERMAQEAAEREQAARELAERKQAERERAECERVARGTVERERAAQQDAQRERTGRERVAQAAAERDIAAQEQAELEHAKRQRAAQEAAERDVRDHAEGERRALQHEEEQRQAAARREAAERREASEFSRWCEIAVREAAERVRTSHDPSARQSAEPQRPARETDERGWAEWVAQEHAECERDGGLTNAIGMNFVLVRAGEFVMGSPEGEEGRQGDEGPQHRVRITRRFYLGATQITQAQWQAVMGSAPWKGWLFAKRSVREGADNPATYVSWDDAIAFCRVLGQRDGRAYRLPTEAEWEYACRAGSTGRYSFGDDRSRLAGYAWYADNASDAGWRYAHRVASMRANPIGLYDMHGNVSEWCSDWLAGGYYAVSPPDDPQGPTAGSYRVNRGGGWSSTPQCCRSASRSGSTPVYRYSDVGFRVACNPR
jgi:formylglycine-generating enzyme required for sulfatase activity